MLRVMLGGDAAPPGVRRREGPFEKLKPPDFADTQPSGGSDGPSDNVHRLGMGHGLPDQDRLKPGRSQSPLAGARAPPRPAPNHQSDCGPHV